MKPQLKLTVLAVFLTTINSQLSTSFAQGSLTPPGAPAATMKSLDQVEPRTPVDAVHTPGGVGIEYLITQSGSYYLTTNLVGVSGDIGIYIGASDVTLDLNGFSVLGAPGAFFGISIVNGNANITVRNGTISGWITEPGIYNNASHVVLEHLNLSGNEHGLNCANDTVVRDCVVSDSGVDGIVLGNNSIVNNCLVQSNAYNGISVQGTGNVVSGNNFCGNNTLGFFGNSAINVTGSNNRVEDNHVTGTGSNGYGIFVSGSTNNIIIKNSVEGSGTNNYSIAALNDAGPIGNAATNTSPWGNFSH
jgi:parallel beta-helix repeat protein